MDIDKLSKRYALQDIGLTVLLSAIGIVAMQMGWVSGVLVPLIVGACFALCVGLADAFIWRFVAKKHPDSLPTFFTAVSGFRLLLALVVFFVYYLAIGRQSMLSFFLVFMAFYLMSLVHHTAFFAKVSNRSF